MKTIQIFIGLVLALVPFLGNDLLALETPENIKAQYSYLYPIQAENLPDGGTRFHKAYLYKRRGLNLLYLSGDRFEMAYQHGRLLNKEIHQGALPQTASMIRNAVMNNFGNIPVVSHWVIRSYYKNITDKMYSSSMKIGNGVGVPLLEGYGLSEGSGLELDTVIRGALGPESMMVLLGQTMSGKQSWLVGDSGSQCSGFAAFGNKTRDGELIIGRNTDYPLNGYYDKFPTVIYYNPTDGVQKYMAFTSAGLHNAGVVGFNESGLYVAVHTVPTLEVSPKGVPVFMIAQEVLRLAKTFDEAVTAFKKYQPASGWTYELVSTREKRSAVIELNNKKTQVIESRTDYQVQTNHYRSQEMKPSYLGLNLSTDNDSYARFFRMEQMIQQYAGVLDEKLAARILGDKHDVLTGAIGVIGNTVAVHTTMTSVVLKPASRIAFVANGTAPVSQSEYVEIPLIPPTPTALANQAYKFFSNHDFKNKYPEKANAEQYFIEAKIAFESKNDLVTSIAAMKKAIQQDSTIPGYLFVLGILQLRNDQYDLAVQSFNYLLGLPDSHYQLLAHYYLGRIFASRREWKKAEMEFNTVAFQADPNSERLILKAAQNALAKMRGSFFYPIKSLELGLMMQQADMMRY